MLYVLRHDCDHIIALELVVQLFDLGRGDGIETERWRAHCTTPPLWEEVNDKLGIQLYEAR